MSRILGFLLGALLSLVAGRASAEPALWSVTDKDSTAYLFGTFHALPPDLDWKSPKIEKAFAESGDLWLEAIEEAPARMQQMAAHYGFDPKTPLNRKLSILERRQLGAALKDIGMPANALQSARPWLAAMTLTLGVAAKAGLSPEAGADKQFEAAAKAAGKKVQGFETMEQQMRFFADLPPELELDMLRQTLGEFEKGVAYLNEIKDAWVAGDLSSLDDRVNGSMKGESPELYNVIIKQRNADWVAQIEQLMQGSGTHFIAVGAGHLVGEHNLPDALAAKGFTVTRQ